MTVSRRRSPAAVVAGLALACAVALTGACGGSGGDSSSDAPAAPGANVDPGATGVVGGSINRAKDVGAQAEQRDAQIEQQGSGATP